MSYDPYQRQPYDPHGLPPNRRPNQPPDSTARPHGPSYADAASTPHDPYQPDTYVPVVPASPSPQGWQPPYPPQVVQHVVAASPPTSGWAVTSFVFGILGVLRGFCLFGIPCVIAVISGHAELIDARNGKGGRGLALAGLVMGYLFVAPAIIVIGMGGLGAVMPGSTSP